MKAETLIYDTVRPIIPIGSEKTVFFASVTETSYEMFFYAFLNGKPQQCYALAEQNVLDENELDSAFKEAVTIIRESKLFRKEKNNIVTFIVDRSGVRMDIRYYEKDVHMYRIKKSGKRKILYKGY